MPTITDAESLEGVAALLADAHTLYDTALPYIRNESVRDALCGVIAVRNALCLRLRDLMAELGMDRRGLGVPGAVDAESLAIHRRLAQGDLAGALCEIEMWDARLRELVRCRAEDGALSPIIADNLYFIVRILDAAPASFVATIGADTPSAAAA